MPEPHDIGLLGLGVMGKALARNLADHGFAVAAWDVSDVTGHGLYQRDGITVFSTPSALVATLERPRRLLSMVPAGAATDAALATIAPFLEPGDVVVDGGNAHFRDTERRARTLAERGVSLIGAGISGGHEGARSGAAIMAGGPPDVWPLVAPWLQTVAAVVDGRPCCARVGPGGSGHFVKTVHNGIEYAVMQILAEAWLLLRYVGGLDPVTAGRVFEGWSTGPLGSFLVETAARTLGATDGATGRPLVAVIADHAAQKGTGRWAVEAALELGVATPTLTQAVFARMLSGDRAPPSSRLPDQGREGRWPEGPALLEQALIDATMIAYVQGFRLLAAASEHHGWSLDLAAIAGLWRGGCIVRARLLEPLRTLVATGPPRPPSPGPALRLVVAEAAIRGIPIPAMSSALAYGDGFLAVEVGAALLQGMRDRFGSHGFERVDRPGAWHHDWTGPGAAETHAPRARVDDRLSGSPDCPAHDP